MRVKDPKGPYMVKSRRPAADEAGRPGEGRIRRMGPLHRGPRQNDRDGFYNEDGPGGVDLNRNFMHQYPYFAPDAGRYMASEAETRAVLDYVLRHRNIAAILAFGESDKPHHPGGRPAPAAGLSLVEFAEARQCARAGAWALMPDLGGAGRGFGRAVACSSSATRACPAGAAAGASGRRAWRRGRAGGDDGERR